MKTSDYISQFPFETFEEVFVGHEKTLSRPPFNISKEDISSKRTQYKKIFKFDRAISELKSAFKTQPDIDISELEQDRLNFLFRQLNSLISWLNQLNTTNTENISGIFQNFQNNVQSAGLLSVISFQIDGVGFRPSGRFLIDEYTKEIYSILESLKVRGIGNSKWGEANEIAENLVANKIRYEEASQIASNWIVTEKEALGLSLQKQAATFGKKAKEHRSFVFEWVAHPFKYFRKHKQPSWSGTIGWLIASLISGVIVMYIVWDFIGALKSNNNISTGAALLRVSALIVPSYFALFFAQQFLNHKRLYEIYKFKDIALEMMNELVKTYTDREEKMKILDRGLDTIFQEPIIKESIASQQQIISDLKDVVKERLKG